MTPALTALPVSSVQGIGPRKAEELAALGIHTVADLLEYYPYRYEDYRLMNLAEAADGEKVTVQGKIYGQPTNQMYGRKKSRLSCRIMADGLLFTAVWFNRAFVRDQLVPGREIVLNGKWDRRRAHLTVSTHEFPGSRAARAGSLQPIYSVGGALTQRWMRSAIERALGQYGAMIAENLPAELAVRRGLMPRRQAIGLLHCPEAEGPVAKARERLAYEELFLYQLKLHAFRAVQREREEGVALVPPERELSEFLRTLPFELTDSQKQAVAEILRDMRQPAVMNRLLQGDVGSGKTLVAAVALFASAKAGYQGALMVPTEILAKQHLRALAELYQGLGLTVELLIGEMSARNRRDILAGLQSGLIDVAVGTHALIQEDVVFRRLGLIVVDEQHRFGVAQRAVLRRKGLTPDVLTMTATPIPRTLAITAFGDMDVSTLRELPKGRKPIQTYWVRPGKFSQVVEMIRRELAAGRQGYAICPLIEESEKVDADNAVEFHAKLSALLPEYRVGLLHGRLPAPEKEELMQEFLKRRIHYLVSTTVIEVGVNVPNATMMVIQDADRFGLSQLHQLRGRVGRGEHASYCILIADPGTEEGLRRLKAMTATTDGFEIARKDLELRGPGDFFGTKQSGAPDFKVADLMADYAVLEQARDDAAELVASRAFWTDARYASLRDYLRREQILEGESLD